MAGERIPAWLRGHLDESHLRRIERAVKDAESRTSAEIVPMIVRRSSAIGQVPMVLTLLLAVTGLLALLAGREFLTDFEVVTAALAVFPVAFGLALILSGFASLQRILIPNFDEEEQVWRRAWAEFAAAGIGRTDARSGVLILVSVMERRAVILADQGAASVVNAEMCRDLVSRMASSLKRDEWGPAFETVIGELSTKLSTALPLRGIGPADQLSNELQIKD